MSISRRVWLVGGLMLLIVLIAQAELPLPVNRAVPPPPEFEIDAVMPAENLQLGGGLVVDGFVGQTVSVYYDNVGFYHDIEKYNFLAQCTCGFGRMERRGWRGTPSEEDVGTHTLSWIVFDKSGKQIHNRSVSIRISKLLPKIKEQKENLSTDVSPIRSLRILFIGDSITRQQYYPNRVFKFVNEYISSNVTTIGRVSLQWDFEHFAQNALPGMRTESYNGWPTYYYLNKSFVVAPEGNPESDVSRPPFWFGPSLEEGVLSYQKYIEKYGENVFPDIVMIMLGTNDFSSLPVNQNAFNMGVDRAVNSMEELITLIQHDQPGTQIFVVNPPPTSMSPYAFKKLYMSDSSKSDSPKVSPLSFKYGHRILTERYQKAFSGREGDGIYYVPAHIGFDALDGYHMDQIVHPSAFGHEQIADQIAAALNRWVLNGAGGLVKQN